MSEKVVLLSSAHPPFDSRIFHREACTLQKAGYEVVSITQHDREETVDGVRLIPLPRPRHRLDRMTRVVWTALRQAWREQAAVYHLHDPELLPAGLVLKAAGKRVIYDAHEMYRDKFRARLWIPRWMRPVVAHAFHIFERCAAFCFDHVIAVDGHIASSFHGDDVAVVPNYPLLRWLNGTAMRTEAQPAAHRTVLIYAGNLSRERGLQVMLDAMDRLRDEPVELRLLGNFALAEDARRVAAMANVIYLGFLPLPAVYEQIARADVGLVLLQPVAGYFHNAEGTNKLFEYMGCGAAVLASDFPGIASIVRSAGAGVCVDPTDSEAVADAIGMLAHDRALMRSLGRNGRRAVFEEYNWERQSRVLLEVYAQVLGGHAGRKVERPAESATPSS